jgi:hypothetical protein
VFTQIWINNILLMIHTLLLMCLWIRDIWAFSEEQRSRTYSAFCRVFWIGNRIDCLRYKRLPEIIEFVDLLLLDSGLTRFLGILPSIQRTLTTNIHTIAWDGCICASKMSGTIILSKNWLPNKFSWCRASFRIHCQVTKIVGVLHRH